MHEEGFSGVEGMSRGLCKGEDQISCESGMLAAVDDQLFWELNAEEEVSERETRL